MIELRHVTKRFSAVTAVNDLSFQAPAGQIIGLLGQNGAGKTTTLNMLTGFFPPSSGQVLVQGQDMLLHPRECKRQIGYLPEQPPLYDEMTVQDYLLFVSTLREVLARSARQHVEEIATLCGLKDMLGRRIGTLSKGYRQRVGFAQALCGNPPVLVLDEPTVGLDVLGYRELAELMHRYAGGEYARMIGRGGSGALGEPGSAGAPGRQGTRHTQSAPTVLWTCHDARFAAQVSDLRIDMAG